MKVKSEQEQLKLLEELIVKTALFSSHGETILSFKPEGITKFVFEKFCAETLKISDESNYRFNAGEGWAFINFSDKTSNAVLEKLKQASTHAESASKIDSADSTRTTLFIQEIKNMQSLESKDDEAAAVATLDSLKVFTEDSVYYKSESGRINLSRGYKIEHFFDDENVRALAEYEYALLFGKTVEQSREEFSLIKVADSTIILGWSEENKAERIREIKQAILLSKDKPVFFIVADGRHIVTIGLLPDLGMGVIQIVYMNSAYGVGSDEYIASKMTGLLFLTELAEMVDQTYNPLGDHGKLQAQISQIYLNPTQQLVNNCGVMTGFNIASLAKYWKDKVGINLDFNEFGII